MEAVPQTPAGQRLLIPHIKAKPKETVMGLTLSNNTPDGLDVCHLRYDPSCAADGGQALSGHSWYGVEPGAKSKLGMGMSAIGVCGGLLRNQRFR